MAPSARLMLGAENSPSSFAVGCTAILVAADVAPLIVPSTTTVSADTVAQYEENKALKTQNAELQDSVATQAGEIKTLKSNEVRIWLLIGGGLVVVGLLFGVAIKSRPKGRNGW